VPASTQGLAHASAPTFSSLGSYHRLASWSTTALSRCRVGHSSDAAPRETTMDQWRMLTYDIHRTPEHLAKLITILRNRHERNHESTWLFVCMQDGPAAYSGLTHMDLSQKFGPLCRSWRKWQTGRRGGKAESSRRICLASGWAMWSLLHVSSSSFFQPTTQKHRHARHRQEGSAGH
jgi:hypothetical protein